MPLSVGFTRAHPPRPVGGVGSVMLLRRRGARGPATSPGSFPPTERAPRYRGALRKYSNARVVMAWPRLGSLPCGRLCRASVSFVYRLVERSEFASESRTGQTRAGRGRRAVGLGTIENASQLPGRAVARRAMQGLQVHVPSARDRELPVRPRRDRGLQDVRRVRASEERTDAALAWAGATWPPLWGSGPSASPSTSTTFRSATVAGARIGTAMSRATRRPGSQRRAAAAGPNTSRRTRTNAGGRRPPVA